ncbi:hypothetical protein GCM10023231_04910 [Olivibacter ginsenosidimutans]|uniref:DUF4134 domain-containing protein n=1 Tax=Olivibacter ginsenosidimutans TaxID=1176537 RepID=A0ABP9AFN1_9SPHI
MNKYITLFLTLFFTVLLCNLVNAQPQHGNSPTTEIGQLLKKIDTVLQKEHIPGLMISIGIVCFLAAYRKMGVTDEAAKELFTSPNATTIFIFVGMLFFGISVVIGAYLLYKCWRQVEKKMDKISLSF